MGIRIVLKIKNTREMAPNAPEYQLTYLKHYTIKVIVYCVGVVVPFIIYFILTIREVVYHTHIRSETNIIYTFIGTELVPLLTIGLLDTFWERHLIRLRDKDPREGRETGLLGSELKRTNKSMG